MKRILLLGDSIRMGYEGTVREELDGLAEVIAPEGNCFTSAHIRDHLQEWILDQDPDLVHINCGLHDIKRAFEARDAGQNQTPLAEYEANVRTIVQTIQDHTDAHILWATTTPVNQDWHHATKGFDRFEDDVRAYNATALAIASELNIAVDDLYAAVMAAGRDTWLAQDGVHFRPEASRALGRIVAAEIRQHADICRAGL